MGINFQLDTTSDLTVKMPRENEAVIAIAAAYVAREQSLPAAERNLAPPLAEMEALLAAATDAAHLAHSGEHSRAGAADIYTSLFPHMTDRLTWAFKGRVRDFPRNIAMIEQWGLNTVMGVNGRLLVFPRRQDDWLALLDSYIAREESLPPAERFADPSLEEMVSLRAELLASRSARNRGHNLRRQSVAQRRETTAVLRDKLLLALHVLVDGRFDGKLTVNLAGWGFPVKASRRRPEAKSDTEPTAVA